MDGEEPDWDALRAAHRREETHLRFLGALLALMGLVATLMAGAVFARVGWTSLVGHTDPDGVLAMVAVGLGLALSFVWVGLGLWRLDGRARHPAALIFAFMLVCSPVVMKLLALSGLYLLYSAKGRQLFSANYAEIQAHTPDAEVNVGAWGCVLLLGFGFLLGAVSLASALVTVALT